MFGWFQPRCPVDVREKVWTEQRMQWLIQQFGLDELLNAEVILPTVEYFPEPFQDPNCDVRVVADRVFDYMGVDPNTIDVSVYPDDEIPETAGLYEKGERSTIRVAESQLDELETLIATLAHETAHVLLHGQDILTGEEDDHEHITDLHMVYKGIGIFAANTAVQQRNNQDGLMEWWSISRLGYLPARVYGYAFALFAWIRNETNPAWSRYLAPDAAAAFAIGMKYLSKTGDCLFDQDTVDRASATFSVSALVSDLDDPSEGVRVAALWKLRERKNDAVSAVDSMCRCLQHPNPIVRCEAAETISTLDTAPESAIEALMSQLSSEDGEVRASVVAALGELQPSLQFRGPFDATVLEEFRRLLDDSRSDVILAAAGALATYGYEVEDVSPAVLRPLIRAVLDCDYAISDYLANVLAKIVPDRDAFLNKELASHDEELRLQVIEAVGHVDAQDP